MQMSSELGYIKEDVSMAGYASFIGMTIIFPILFRLKFRFTTRSILLTVCPILIVCNLITMHTSNIALMIVVCFISGFFRMWGTFECFSNMRLTITPAGDFSTFYPVIYIIVLESIQLSGLVATHITDWANWRYMHWFVIAMVSVVWLCVFLFTRHFRPGKVVPLYNIDWLGAALWVAFLFSIVFICKTSLRGTGCVHISEVPYHTASVSCVVYIPHHIYSSADSLYEFNSEVRHTEFHIA